MGSYVQSVKWLLWQSPHTPVLKFWVTLTVFRMDEFGTFDYG